MKAAMKFIAIISLTFLLSGCATLADSVAAKGTGEFRVYDEPYELVWNTVLQVISESKLQLISESSQSGQILAQRGVSALSYGDNVAIFVERFGGEESTRVEVVSKKAMSTTVFSKNWETEVLAQLTAKLYSAG